MISDKKINNKIIKKITSKMLSKIEKSFEIINILYENNLITDVYIVGSVAKGTANQYSDIEINIVNPLFEIQNLSDLSPIVGTESSPNIKMVVDQLKDIGIKFKIIKIKDLEFWYQIHRNELLHIVLSKDEKFSVKPRIRITKEQMIVDN